MIIAGCISDPPTLEDTDPDFVAEIEDRIAAERAAKEEARKRKREEERKRKRESLTDADKSFDEVFEELKQIEQFYSEDSSTGGFDKCVLKDDVEMFAECLRNAHRNDIHVLTDALRNLSAEMCNHCDRRPCEDSRDEVGNLIPCDSVYRIRELLGKYGEKPVAEEFSDDDMPF